MVSSKDQSKKISQGLRQLGKKFFEDFYAKAEAAGRFPPHPLEAGAAFGRMLERAAKEYEGPPPDHPGVSAEVFEALLDRRLFLQVYHEAVEAWFRHTPGLEIKKRKPGRKPNVELAKRIWALSDAGSTSRKIQAALKKDGINLTQEGIEYYRKTQRRPRKE